MRRNSRRYLGLLAAVMMVAAGSRVLADEGKPPPGPLTEPVPGPHLTAGELLALRGETRGEVMELEYQVRCETRPQGEAPSQSCNEFRRIILGQDYVALVTARAITVIDRALDRWLVLDPQKKTFANFSLTAGMRFKYDEIRHRRNVTAHLLSLIKKGELQDGVQPQKVDTPIWAGIDLGVPWSVGEEIPEFAYTKPRDGKGKLYLAVIGEDQLPIARLELSDVQVPVPLRPSHRAAQRLFFRLHPMLVTNAAPAKRLLKSFDAYWMQRIPGVLEPGKSEVLVIDRWKLSDRRLVERDYPLSEDYRSAGLAANFGSDKAAFEAMLTGAARGNVPPGKSAAEYRAFIRQALEKDDPLDAVLALQVASGVYPAAFHCAEVSVQGFAEPDICGSVRRTRDQAKDTRDGERYFEALAEAREKRFREAAETLEAIDTSRYVFGHQIALTRARMLSDAIPQQGSSTMMDVREADVAMVSALSASFAAEPYNTHAYAAATRWLYNKYQHQAAWQYHELAIALPLGWDSRALNAFRDIEESSAGLVDWLFDADRGERKE